MEKIIILYYLSENKISHIILIVSFLVTMQKSRSDSYQNGIFLFSIIKILKT